MKDIGKVSFVIIGTMVGAGFASGQEIAFFFNQYGNIGIIGLLISAIITGTIIYKVFNILQTSKVQTHAEFLNTISNKPNLNRIIEIIIQLFLLISFYIMIAGFCAYFKQELGIPTYISAIIIAILCYITFGKNIKGVISINAVLMPLLILFIMYLGIRNVPFILEYVKSGTGSANTGNTNINIQWLISSILYASYNSILLIPMLIELSKYMTTKEKIKKVSIFCAINLFALGTCLFSLILNGTRQYFKSGITNNRNSKKNRNSI